MCVELGVSHNKSNGGVVAAKDEQKKREFSEEERCRLADFINVLIKLIKKKRPCLHVSKKRQSDSPWTEKVATADYVAILYRAMHLEGLINGDSNVRTAKMQ